MIVYYMYIDIDDDDDDDDEGTLINACGVFLTLSVSVARLAALWVDSVCVCVYGCMVASSAKFMWRVNTENNSHSISNSNGLCEFHTINWNVACGIQFALYIIHALDTYSVDYWLCPSTP